MKLPTIPAIIPAAVLAVVFVLPGSALAFKCSQKLNSCSGIFQQKICDDFRRAALTNKRRCDKFFGQYKNTCGNNTCCTGVRETYDSCIND